jgi:hypothetical protein
MPGSSKRRRRCAGSDLRGQQDARQRLRGGGLEPKRFSSSRADDPRAGGPDGRPASSRCARSRHGRWRRSSGRTRTARRISGVPTGFVDLDASRAACSPGRWSSRRAAGHGEDLLAMNIAHNAAAAGTVVGVFSLEMPNEELFIRQIAATRGSTATACRAAIVSERDWARIAEAVNAIASRRCSSTRRRDHRVRGALARAPVEGRARASTC